MGSQPSIALKKQGDANAIAQCIHQTLPWKEGAVRVGCKRDELQILLEAAQLPEPQICLKVIYATLTHLSIAEFQSVTIFARQPGARSPLWSQTVPIRRSQPSAPQPAPKPKTRQSRGVLLLLTVLSFGLGISWGRVVNSEGVGVAQIVSATVFLATSSPQTVPLPATTNLTESIPDANTFKFYPTSLTIKAVGDIIPGTNFPYNKLHPQPEVLFQSVKPYLQNADLVFGNFESTLTNSPYSAKKISSRSIAFRTPPEYAQLLKDVGFDVLSVANNHSMDFAQRGFDDTIRYINATGMTAVGKKDEIVYLEVENVPVALIGFSTYRYHNSINDLEAAKALIQEASQNAKLVVVSVHAGAEGTDAMRVRDRYETFFGENRGNLVKFSRMAIDNGADLILGHGPHVPRAIQLYKNKLIAYSLGNFMGYRTLVTTAQLGYSKILEIEVDPDGNFISGKIVPVHLDRQGIPSIDQYFRSVQLMRHLTESDFPQTPLGIETSGKISKLES